MEKVKNIIAVLTIVCLLYLTGYSSNDSLVRQLPRESTEVSQMITSAQQVIALIDETTLYYTFSTIAQTLAGAFGILGAFVLYRLQGVNNTTKEMAEIFNKVYYAFKNHFYDSYYVEYWDDYISEMEKFYKECFLPGVPDEVSGVHKTQFAANLSLFKRNLKAKKMILKRVKIALFVTVISIALSLIALPLIPGYVGSETILYLLVLALFNSILCLGLYAGIVMVSLGIMPLKSKTETKETGV